MFLDEAINVGDQIGVRVPIDKSVLCDFWH